MMLIYAAAVLLSASLLFLVQPLIAKIILPWFGGASAVWSAALVFFQVCLLAAYAYAHLLTTHVRPRAQVWIHCALLLAACLLMPILPAASWRDETHADPALRILLLLTATVGLPAFLLSATSPLLQVWYLRSRGGEAPYWLFALSNAGSLLALMSFPILLEPVFGAPELAYAWSALFVVFAGLCAFVGWTSRTGATINAPVTTNAPAPGLIRMVFWVLFAACASALLVAVSAQLSTNVAPIPLLWVVPLALYLLTFILNFASRRFCGRGAFLPWLALAIGGMAYLYSHSNSNISIYYVIPAYLVCLFIICMACHGEVVHLRPPAKYLTRFYLLIALGGALGGFAVGILAPLLFETYLELPVLLVLIAELWIIAQWHGRGSARKLWLVRVAMVVGIVALACYLAVGEIRVREEHLLLERNFYGTLRVRDEYTGDEFARRNLLHGTISHGFQFQDAAYRDIAVSYYSSSSGVGRVLEVLEQRGPVRVGVVGLGVGVLASYARAGDYFRIYEINPAVVDIADQHFTYLSRARESGANLAVLLGDARLVLERQERQKLDLLAIDAFSSDAIPTHLLTNEAIALYFEHLQPDGVLAIHISNRYLDLVPVCVRAAEHVNVPATIVRNERDSLSNASTWVLITADASVFQDPQFEGADIAAPTADKDFLAWTDEYSSLWPLLKMR